MTLLVISGTWLLSSCIKEGEPQPQLVGGSTFINAFTEANAVYCYIDRSTVPALNPLPYRNYGPITPVYAYPGEDRRLEIYSTYNEDPLVDTAITIRDSVYYSTFVFGTHDNPQHFITIDRVPENTDDPAAIAAVRFFNLANTDKKVTLRIGDLELDESFENRPTETAQTGKDNENFIPVPTGSYTVSVIDENGETLVTRETEIDLSAGKYVSIFLTGDEVGQTSFYIGRLQQWVN